MPFEDDTDTDDGVGIVLAFGGTLIFLLTCFFLLIDKCLLMCQDRIASAPPYDLVPN